jgi:hypothetical protein
MCIGNQLSCCVQYRPDLFQKILQHEKISPFLYIHDTVVIQIIVVETGWFCVYDGL